MFLFCLNFEQIRSVESYLSTVHDMYWKVKPNITKGASWKNRGIYVVRNEGYFIKYLHNHFKFHFHGMEACG